MKTPRTEAVVRMAVGPMREYAIIEHAQNLERELEAERAKAAELEAMIVAFCENQSWAVDAWKKQDAIAPLFAVAKRVKST